MKTIKKAVIPAAGYGTRFLPITKVVPKELLPIGNKPAIQYVVEEAVEAGIEEIILICHPSKMDVADYFRPDDGLSAYLKKKGKNEELEELERIETLADFRVVYQKEPLGLGHAICCAQESLKNEPFLVMLPDVVMLGETQECSEYLIRECVEEDRWGVLLEKVPTDRLSNYGLIKGEKLRDGIYQLNGAVEKPTIQKAPSNLAMLGRYVFTSDIFDCFGGLKGGVLGEIQLTDAIDRLAKKEAGLGVLSRADTFDVGTPEGLRRAYQFLDESFGLPMKRIQKAI